ncbi:MAG: hypothetical protein JW717_09255 [Marinilabiliaceae bacterium]|nr:hypothetical protein [Marinilabiliaceae bacterium]
MKKIIITISIALTSVIVIAQNETDDIKTIFGNTEYKTIGGYGALSTSYGAVNGLDAIFIGGRGAVILNHSLALGLGGKGFISETINDKLLEEDYEFTGGYGGFYIEPIIGAKRPLHLSFPVLIGAGGVGYIKHWGDEDPDNDYDNYDEDSEAFFVLEPGIELELNLIKFMRIAIIGSYRYTTNINLNYTTEKIVEGREIKGGNIGSSDMLRGFNVGLIMKFGKF